MKMIHAGVYTLPMLLLFLSRPFLDSFYVLVSSIKAIYIYIYIEVKTRLFDKRPVNSARVP